MAWGFCRPCMRTGDSSGLSRHACMSGSSFHHWYSSHRRNYANITESLESRGRRLILSPCLLANGESVTDQEHDVTKRPRPGVTLHPRVVPACTDNTLNQIRACKTSRDPRGHAAHCQWHGTFGHLRVFTAVSASASMPVSRAFTQSSSCSLAARLDASRAALAARPS